MANEKRNLIDRDDLIDSLGVSDMEIFAKEVIGDATTVDAVEVVRCRECYFGKGELICTNPKCTKSFYGCPVPPEHFCSYGERKDNEC